MVKNFKKISIIKGLDKNLTNYRKRKYSLSSNILVNLLNGYIVYKFYLKMGYVESFYRLFILSINYLRKNLFCQKLILKKKYIKFLISYNLNIVKSIN